MSVLVCVGASIYTSDPAIFAPTGELRPQEAAPLTNPADEHAIAIARRLDEEGVVLAHVGPRAGEELLRLYAGLGGERFMLLEADFPTDPYFVADALAWLVGELGDAGLVLCGERLSGSAGSGLTGPLLAGLLNRPLVAGASRLEIEGGQLLAEQLLPGGDRRLLRVPLPALATVSAEAVDVADAPGYFAYARMRRAVVERVEIPERVTSARKSPPEKIESVTRARPKPRRVYTPPATASAADRMRLLMTGGAAQPKKEGNVVEEDPEKAADAILRFLRQEKLIDDPENHTET